MSADSEQAPAVSTPCQPNPASKSSALDVTKVVAGAAALSYLVGVLTVSIYLHRLDIAAPDLTTFKARYIYTGLIVLLWLALAAGAIWIAARALFGRNLPGVQTAYSGWWALLFVAALVVTTVGVNAW